MADEPLPDWLASKPGLVWVSDDIVLSRTEVPGKPEGGYLFIHRAPEQDVTTGWCVGQIQFPPHGLIQRDPLTVDGSVLCVNHGTHGWIRDGAWVPA